MVKINRDGDRFKAEQGGVLPNAEGHKTRMSSKTSSNSNTSGGSLSCGEDIVIPSGIIRTATAVISKISGYEGQKSCWRTTPKTALKNKVVSS